MENDSVTIDNVELNGKISIIPENIPYSVNRSVIKQNELENISGYFREKDGSELIYF